MDIFGRIAEERIREAMQSGQFDDLRGSGKPLVFEDETWIPEDLRIAYRLLKNSGCIPPELEERKAVVTLRELIETIDDEKERIRKIRELNFRLLKLNMARKRPLLLDEMPGYGDKIERLFLGEGG